MPDVISDEMGKRLAGSRSGRKTGQGCSYLPEAGYKSCSIDGYWLEMREGSKNIDGENLLDSLKIDAKVIYLRTEVTKDGSIKFHYSLNNLNYIRFGNEVVSNFWGYLGIRHALCCYNLTKGNPTGSKNYYML